LFVLLATLLGACQGGDKREQGPKQAGPLGSAPILVGIVPANPSVEDDLRLDTSVAEVGSCRWLRNGVIIDKVEGGCLPRGNFAKGDTLTVAVVADGKEAKASVIVRNGPPRVTSVNFTPPEFHRGMDLTAEVLGSDPDGDEVSFHLAWVINGEEQSWEKQPIIKGDRFRRGDRLSLRVIPLDGEAEGPAHRSSEVVVPNAPPRFLTSPPQGFQGERFVYAVKAEDADGDPLVYQLVQGPSSSTIDPVTGLLVWDGVSEGEHHIRINVRDDQGSKADQEFVLRIKRQQP
jgi:hypothetical protein